MPVVVVGGKSWLAGRWCQKITTTKFLTAMMNPASSSAAGQRRSNRQQRKVPPASTSGGEDNRSTTTSISAAMPLRRSSSSNSLSSVKSNGSATSRMSGSFASATASSLNHGGPASVAPPPSSLLISTPRRTLLLPPLPRMKTELFGNSGNNDNHDDHADAAAGKENATNSESTPTKNRSSADDITPPIMLSPTPQWRADRLGYVTGRVRVEKSTTTTTTPTRATRSATKKKIPIGDDEEAHMTTATTLDDLADMDDDNNDDKEDDDDGEDTTTSLLQSSSQSTPPDRKFEIQSARNAQRRRTAVAEAERHRLEKVRKRGESMMSRGLREHSPSASLLADRGGGRMVSTNKRTKRDVSSPALVVGAVEAANKNDEDAKRPSIATSIVAPGPSEEDLRRIVLESLASNESTKVEALIARVATAERDASHHKEMYEVVKAKYDTLKCRIDTEGGTDNELRIKYAEQRGVMNGYETEVRRLELEKLTITSRYELEYEAYERERKNMQEEISGIKEAHAAEIQRLMDDASSLARETLDHDTEGYDVIVSKLDKATQRNERLKANNAAAKDVMMSRIAELEESEVNLKSLLDVEKIDNDANRDLINELRNNVATHVATILKHEKNVSSLENKVHSITQALDDVKRQMEMMYSPRTGDALEVEADELREELSAMKDENVKLQDTLQERDEAYQTLSSQLDVTKVERDEFETQLSDTSSAVEEATVKAAKLKVKIQQLNEELQTAHAKQTENEGMLEEMAEENEELIASLEETESIMKQRWEEASRNADQEVSELTLKFDTVTAERDMLDGKLKTAQGELTSLQDQMSKHEVEFATLQHTLHSLQSDKQVSDNKVLELSTQLHTITEQLESTKSTCSILESKLRSKDEYCEQFKLIERQLREEKRVLNEIRANLHNRVIQLSGNIRVFVRVRPLVESERLLTSSLVQPTRYQFASRSGASNSSSRPSSRGSMGPTASRPASRDGEETNDESCPFHFPAITDRNTTRPSSSSSGDGGGSFNDLTKQVIELTEPYKDRGGLKERRKKWKYGFDRVFNQTNGQRDVWEGAEPLVQSCIDGFHVCMFAYGQVSYSDRLCILICFILCSRNPLS